MILLNTQGPLALLIPESLLRDLRDEVGTKWDHLSLTLDLSTCLLDILDLFKKKNQSKKEGGNSLKSSTCLCISTYSSV
jgi:hypothetical protein